LTTTETGGGKKEPNLGEGRGVFSIVQMLEEKEKL